MQLWFFNGYSVFYAQGLPGGFGIPGRPGEPGAKVRSSGLCFPSHRTSC